MANEPRPDEEVAEEILGVLRDDASETPPDLPDKTIQKVRALITTRDLIDLTTFVFILRFCAPIVDLLVAILGGEREPSNREPNDGRSES